ncbi:MAG: TonB-dependent receptor [Pseudomonadota bacterium]
MRTTHRSGSTLAGILLSGAALAPIAQASETRSSSNADDEANASIAFSDAQHEALPSRKLNVGLGQGGVFAPGGETVSFMTYWNYDREIAFSSVRIFKASDTRLSSPVADIPFTRETAAEWQMPEGGNGEFIYVLRVYNQSGLYDETRPKLLKRGAVKALDTSLEHLQNQIKSEDNTAVQNIQITPRFRVKSETRVATDKVQVEASKVVEADSITVPSSPSVKPTLEAPSTAPDDEVEKSVPTEAKPDLTAELDPVPEAPATRILVGETYWADAVSAEKPDRESDDLLRQSDIHVSFDGLDVQPLLNVGLVGGGTSVVPGAEIQFQTYWNYSAFIDRAQIEVYDPTDQYISAPVAVLLVDSVTGRADWTVPAYRRTDRYTYVLRVFDEAGQSDLTDTKNIALVTETESLENAPNMTGPIYGEDATARRNIDVRGGAITVSGTGFTGTKAETLSVRGKPVKTDPDGSFAIQEIMRPGEHDVAVRYKTADGKVVRTTKSAEIPESEMFFIALGDLTVGTRSSEGRALLEASGEDFEETYVTGRGAFYLKGKIQGRYLLTASMDTTEDDIDNLFSNLSDKDPQSILRRVDPDRYYPVYGDNSTYVEDAPTQGRFYVRLEDGDDHVVWGNFFTDVTNTEFAQIDRGLYGAKAEYNSDATTEDGEKKLRATVFAADPGTIPGRQEFRGTGGSVYFLENQDVTIGSERLRVELRDQDSGLVLETRELRPFVDYEIDYIQGRVILAAPLASTELNDQVVRDGVLSGAAVYLVARYEYTQAFVDVDGYSTGGRAEAWLSKLLRLGVTAQSEETGDADQTLVAGDVLLKKSERTFLKAELAQTEGAAFEERSSLDGGFTFNPLTTGVVGSQKATAWRVEGALTGEDFDLEQPLSLNGFYEDLEAGFSAPGRLTRGDTTRFGFGAQTEINDRASLALKYDSVSIDDAVDEDTAAADLRIALNDDWSAGLGLRYNELSGPLSQNSGDRTDAGLEIRNQVHEALAVYGFGQATLDTSGDREDLNRIGLGIESRVWDALQVRGEISGGDGGTGALAGVTWQRSDGEEYYLNYTLDADRTEPGVDGTSFLPNTQNSLTLGGKRRFTSTLSVYGEERATFGDRAGLTHAYGLDYTWNDHWTFGASFEIGDVEEFTQTLEREAYTVTAGYADDAISAGAALEWRSDEDATAKRDTWLFRSNLGVKVSPDWTAILKYNIAESDFTGGAFFDGDFTELQVAGAYRPTENDRLNALFRYTYFEELPSAEQISNSAQSGLPAQKSNIFSADANYRVTNWLTLGGKIGHRDGEVSLSRTEDDFVENSATLLVGRADVHFVKKWDALIELRSLEVDAAQDKKTGALAAIYRHVGNNAKVGLGYNFTDFSDDLTDLSFNDNGLFLNVVAKF